MILPGPISSMLLAASHPERRMLLAPDSPSPRGDTAAVLARTTGAVVSGSAHPTRREFLLRTAGGLGAALLGSARPVHALESLSAASVPGKMTSVRRLKKPVAIAMWDFCWLVRRYPGGGFEDWDRALDELADRGYDAVRLDVFPHLISLAERQPARRQIRFAGAPAGTHMLWGNDVDVTVDIRQSLIDFLPKCRQRGIKISLSTWFRIPADPTIPRVEGFDHFVQVWEDTLDFMEKNDLLQDILFIDLDNEFPFFSGFKWLRFAAEKAAKIEMAEAKVGQENLQDIRREGGLSQTERSLYQDFSTRVLQHFRTRHPRHDFTLSHSVNMDAFHPERYTNVGAMDVLDTHIWFGHHPLMGKFNMGNAQAMTATQLGERYGAMKKTWAENRGMLIPWMDERLAEYAALGKKNGAIVGNTEGWGQVGWDDIPPLDWEFIKESGDICADLAIKHGFKFICTSNFTHPYFKRLWADRKWHRAITARIRSGGGNAPA